MTDSKAKKAVLLVNLGTPVAPTASAVRSFLRQFLWDPRVVEVPRPVWWLILNLFILPFRPGPVAKNYKQLWLHFGDSPLRIFSKSQQEKLQLLYQQNKHDIEVVTAMTYGQPSIAGQLDVLSAKGIEQVLVLPLYPQYSATTTAAVYDQVAEYQKKQRDIMDIRFCKQYYQHPAYAEALKKSLLQFWEDNGRSEKLLLSYHGIPKRNVDLGDPYDQQCKNTTEMLVNMIGLKDDEYVHSYQSRLGKAEWLQPYTSVTVEQLAKAGVTSLDVICPSFSVDCLETLEEIAIENAEVFISAGGEHLNLVPCLNDNDEHIEALFQISMEYFNEASADPEATNKLAEVANG